MTPARIAAVVSRLTKSKGRQLKDETIKVIDICNRKLTEPQIRSVEQLFLNNPKPYYKECRKIVKSIITIEINHNIETDKWAMGMRNHYKEVLRIMESFYRLAQSVIASDESFMIDTLPNG